MWANGYAILVYLIPSAYMKTLLPTSLVRIPPYHAGLLDAKVTFKKPHKISRNIWSAMYYFHYLCIEQDRKHKSKAA